MGLFDKILGFLGGKSGRGPRPSAPGQIPSQPGGVPGKSPAGTVTDPRTGRVYALGTQASRSPAVNQQSVRVPPVQTPRPAPPRKPPETRTLNLDASMFTPLSGSEIVAQLRGRGASSWEIFRAQGLAWWGNRSIIPPSSDERTQFIDRGMVGQGMVTPEELAEIHKVGDEMLRIKPELDQAAMIAEEAVQQSKQEKEAIKKRKKAEAEQRKQAHARAVAERRTTDIIYLGRGVSRGLSDRRANIEKLHAAGLPVLATPRDVTEALGITIPQLRWLAFHAEAASRPHYHRFTVPKKSGGTRELAAPHRKLAAAQDWILGNILEKVPAHSAAHGFVKGRSTCTNALPHAHQFALINCDLKDFFPTITVYRVIGLFTDLGYSPAAATILGLLCTEPPRRVVDYAGQTFHVATGPRCLPQGASTSPAISNLIVRRLDSRLSGICAKLGFTYTRYADDLSFSVPANSVSPEDPAHPNRKIGYLLARIRHITQDEGFTVNEKKTRVQRQNSSQRVTGIVVNSSELTVPRKVRRQLRAVLHQARTTGLAAQNVTQRPYFESYVRGMVAYIHMVNPAQALPLRQALGELPR